MSSPNLPKTELITLPWVVYNSCKITNSCLSFCLSLILLTFWNQIYIYQLLECENLVEILLNLPTLLYFTTWKNGLFHSFEPPKFNLDSDWQAPPPGFQGINQNLQGGLRLIVYYAMVKEKLRMAYYL